MRRPQSEQDQLKHHEEAARALRVGLDLPELIESNKFKIEQLETDEKNAIKAFHIAVIGIIASILPWGLSLVNIGDERLGFGVLALVMGLAMWAWCVGTRRGKPQVRLLPCLLATLGFVILYGIHVTQLNGDVNLMHFEFGPMSNPNGKDVLMFGKTWYKDQTLSTIRIAVKGDESIEKVNLKLTLNAKIFYAVNQGDAPISLKPFPLVESFVAAPAKISGNDSGHKVVPIEPGTQLQVMRSTYSFRAASMFDYSPINVEFFSVRGERPTTLWIKGSYIVRHGSSEHLCEVDDVLYSTAY